MKTILLVTALAVAVLLAAFVLLAAASTYLGSIDADRFRPQIQAALEKRGQLGVHHLRQVSREKGATPGDPFFSL